MHREELHDAAPDKVTESRELRHVLMPTQERRLRNGHDLLVRNEAQGDAPCSDEELAVFIFGHGLRRGDLDASSRRPQDALSDGDAPSMDRNVLHPN